MVVLRKIDVENDETIVKINENNQKGRCLLRFHSSDNP
jgi:hypothetical protein